MRVVDELEAELLRPRASTGFADAVGIAHERTAADEPPDDQLTTTGYGDRLRAAMDALAARCAPASTRTAALLDAWGLPDDVAGLERFALTCVEAFAGRVAVVKPQSAFFERVRLGAGSPCSSGRWPSCARPARCRCSTPSAATSARRWRPTPQAYLGRRLAAAPPTPSPSAPTSATSRCAPRSTSPRTTGRGRLRAALTSNPEGPSVQHAGAATASPSRRRSSAGVAARQRDGAAPGRLGSVGLVVGATVGSAVTDLGLDLAAAAGPLLAPGLGAQGGTAAALRGRLRRGPAPGAAARAAARCSWPGPTPARCAMPRGRAADDLGRGPGGLSEPLPTCADPATWWVVAPRSVAIESTPYSRALSSQHLHVDEGLILWPFRRSPQSSGPPPSRRPPPPDASAPRSRTA